MAHSTSTTPAITAVGPSEPGALGGFEVRCPDCAEVARFSLRSLADQHARDHVAFMLRKEQADAKAARKAAKANRFASYKCPGCESCDPAIAAAYEASMEAAFADWTFDR